MGRNGPKNLASGVKRTRAPKPRTSAPARPSKSGGKSTPATKSPRNLKAPTTRTTTKARNPISIRPLPTRAKGKI